MISTNVAKRTLCLLLLAALLVLTAAPALASSNSGAYVVSTSGHDRLRVHSSANGSVKAYLKRGAVVVYKGQKNGWWKVEYRGGSGYVDWHYLTPVSALPKAKYKSVDNLWVRNKPKTSAAKLGKLKTSMRVTIVQNKGAWVCIARKGHTGWVPAKFLRRVS